MSWPAVIQGNPGDQFQVDTDEGANPVGQGMEFNDGRRFRRVQAPAGTAMVTGKLYQAAIPVPDHVLQTPGAAIVGARTVSLALGATAVAVDQYRGGLLVIDLATNTGFGAYGIGRHAGVAASGTMTVPLTEPVQVAIATTANSVSLVPNRHRGVILAVATTPTAQLAGVSVKAIAAGSFGWIQTKGPCVCLTTGTIVIGQKVIPSTTTGAVIVEAAFSVYPTIGQVVRVAVTTAYSTIDLIGLEG